MTNKDRNIEFLSWYGCISRKDYAVNMLIVCGLYTAVSLIRFEALRQFIPFEFIYTVLIFTAEFLKFVLMISAVSLVYRRISDFTAKKTYKIKNIFKNIFIVLFIIPLFYFVLRSFLFIPALIQPLDLLVIFILLPAALIFALISCFIKG